MGTKINGPVTACPDCQGPVYDNRDSKKNPKQPDFRCRNRDGCGWVGWLPRDSGGSFKRESVAQYTWAELALTYRKCHQIAVKVVGEQDTQAATATLFIQACKMGLKETE